MVAPPGSGSPSPLPVADDEDAELVARHVAGDPDAFPELVRRHRDRLWAVALRTLGDPEEAADALQDALLSAFRRASTYRGEARVTTWLHRIVVNACLDRVRRRAARPTIALEALRGGDGSGEGTDRLAVLAVTDPDPAEAHGTRLDVLAALATLPAQQRAALVLVDMEGWSVSEAAVVLDCPEGTVKSRCARGRARLLPLLAHLRPAPPAAPPAARPPAPAPAPARNATAAANVPPERADEEGAG